MEFPLRLHRALIWKRQSNTLSKLLITLRGLITPVVNFFSKTIVGYVVCNCRLVKSHPGVIKRCINYWMQSEAFGRTSYFFYQNANDGVVCCAHAQSASTNKTASGFSHHWLTTLKLDEYVISTWSHSEFSNTSTTI